MKVAIAVFVKTPGLSPVKTRLAATLGYPLAGQFFLLAKSAIEAVLMETRTEAVIQGIELKTYWAIGEVAGVKHPMWQSRQMECMHTGEGGLGERLHQVYASLLVDHDAVLLLGMDSPQNTPSNLFAAIDYFSEPGQYVFGPAHDGGFYLFGANAPVALSDWTAVTYSADDTLMQLVQQLNAPEEQVLFLDTLTDVDTEPDLEQVCLEMADRVLPEQADVFEWIRYTNARFS